MQAGITGFTSKEWNQEGNFDFGSGMYDKLVEMELGLGEPPQSLVFLIPRFCLLLLMGWIGRGMGRVRIWVGLGRAAFVVSHHALCNSCFHAFATRPKGGGYSHS